jgi:hypothetical protein
MWKCDRRLYRSRDNHFIVEEEDPRAGFLIVGPGDELESKPKVEPLKKAIDGPEENKMISPKEDMMRRQAENKGKGKGKDEKPVPPGQPLLTNEPPEDDEEDD